jgi:hypothetical protein
LNVRLELSLGCADSDVANKLASVLSPDNRSVPSDQLFEMSQSGPSVSFKIESERQVSAFSSLDSVLTDAALFQKLWLLSRRRRA